MPAAPTYDFKFGPHFLPLYLAGVQAMADHFRNGQVNFLPFHAGARGLRDAVASVPLLTPEQLGRVDNFLDDHFSRAMMGDPTFDPAHFGRVAIAGYQQLALLPIAAETIEDAAMRLQYVASVRQLNKAACDRALADAQGRQKWAYHAMGGLIGTLVYYGFEDVIREVGLQRMYDDIARCFSETPGEFNLYSDLDNGEVMGLVTCARGLGIYPRDLDITPESLVPQLLAHRNTLSVPQRRSPTVPRPAIFADQSTLAVTEEVTQVPSPLQLTDTEGRLVIEARVKGPHSISSEYRIFPTQLGEGGCATVYLGERVRSEGEGLTVVRQVAIKVARIDDPAMRDHAVDAYQHELRLQMGELGRDPNIVRVDDAGMISATGAPFIVMECMTGGTLEDEIERMMNDPSRFDLKRSVSWMTKLVATLTRTHAKGVAHRDIKPGNIFLAGVTEGVLDDIKISDFGISETMGEINELHARHGTLPGTPRYQPPEAMVVSIGLKNSDQLEPWLQEASHNINSEQWDVYSAGAVMYELLSRGRHPHDLIPGLEGTEANVLLYGWKVVQDLQRTDFQPDMSPLTDIPEELKRILRKALAPNPAQRYQKMADFLFDLTNYQARTRCDRAQEICQEAEGAGREVKAWTVKARTNQWVELFKEGIGEYLRTYEEYPTDRLKEEILQRLLWFYQWAEPYGRLDIMEYVKEEMGHLEPSHLHVESIHVFEPSRFTIQFLGQAPRGSRPQITITRQRDEGGILEEDPGFERSLSVSELNALAAGKGTLELERGRYVYRLNFFCPGLVPFSGPLRVCCDRDPNGRVIPYPVVIPLVDQMQLPPGYVMINPGKVAAWQEAGSFAEQIDPVMERDVLEPFAIGPMPTVGQWYQFLMEQWRGNPEMAEILWPRNWQATDRWQQTQSLDDIIYADSNNEPVNPMAPVTHTTDAAVEIYLDYLTQLLRSQAVDLKHPLRLPEMSELKRAMRGDTALRGPAGDDIYIRGLYGNHTLPTRRERRLGIDKPEGMSPLPNNAEGSRDFAIYWDVKVVGGRMRATPRVPHIFGNARKLAVVPSKARPFILRSHGLLESDVGNYDFALGTAHNEAPADLDSLTPVARGSILYTRGFMPVVTLIPLLQRNP